MEKYAFELHMHSCLSPCGDRDNTPANLAAMCALAGLEVVALTDHNAVGNCAPFLQEAAKYGLLALPGLELTTREEVHVICLFETLAGAEGFGELVRARLPRAPNNPAVFGSQILMDGNDAVAGEERALLSAAAEIGIYEVSGLVRSFGGVAFPAHIDRPAFSLLGNLGLWDPDLNFLLAEVTERCPPDLFARSDLAGVRSITACDAHYLHQIPDARQFMSLEEKTAGAVLDWLRNGPDSPENPMPAATSPRRARR